jgi:hypothetical protein
MNENSVVSAEHKPSAPGVIRMLRNAKDGIRDGYSEFTDHVRQAPTPSILAAVAVGYCLRAIPVRTMIVAHVQLLAALSQPALFAYGATKFYQFLFKAKIHSTANP